MDKNAVNAWKMLYNFIERNVYLKMIHSLKEKDNDVDKMEEKDVFEIIDYIKHGLENIIKNTIEKDESKQTEL